MRNSGVEVVGGESFSIEGRLLMLDEMTPHVAVPVQVILPSPSDGRGAGGEGEPQVIATTLSDEKGKYRFFNLKPGRYQVRCQILGGEVYYGDGEILQVEDSRFTGVEPGTPLTNIDFRFAPFKKGSWKNYTFFDGLVHNRVRAIHRAPDGVMWFGTEGGLSRFDGKVFVNFTTQDGLTNNEINVICGIPDGDIWFGTNGGVSRYDGKQFVTFTQKDGLANNRVRAIYRAPDGVMWFGTEGGVSRYDGHWFVTFTQKDGLAGNIVNHICSTPDGMMWFAMGGGGGVSRYDGKVFVTLTTKDGLAHNRVYVISRDPNGVMWFGTHGGGVSRYDGKAFVTLTTQDGLANNWVYAIQSTPDGVLWFGTDSGVSRFEGKTFVNFTVQDGLVCNLVRAIHRGADGALWFGTSRGVSRYEGADSAGPMGCVNFTTQDGLANNGVHVIYQDSDGTLWIGTHEGGVSRYDGKQFVTFTTKDGLAHNRVYAIHRDPDGILWFGTAGGLSQSDGRAFVNFTTKNGLPNNLIGCIYRHPDGFLWLGTDGGVCRYDGKQFVTFTTKDGLAHYEVTAIHRAPNGVLWFGTRGGVSRYDGKTFVNFTTADGLVDNSVVAIYGDPGGVIWLGTQGGVSQYDGKAFVNFATKDGLADGYVVAIHRDPSGLMWFGTLEGGVLCYDGTAWTSLDTRDGLADNGVLSIIQDPDGSLWFGGGGGLTRYRRDKIPPRVRIVAVTTYQRYTDLNALEPAIVGTRVTFEYTSIDFKTHPTKRQYRHRIYERPTTREHASKQDAEMQDSRFKIPPESCILNPVSYSPPTKQTTFEWIPQEAGTYLFEVQAIDRDLNYSEPASVTFTVVTPSLMEELQRTREALESAEERLSFLSAQEAQRWGIDRLIGKSRAIQSIVTNVRRLQEVDRTNVLILGETGTGKDLIALAIHFGSPRGNGPFISVNCTTIPDHLAESQLFGHLRGAFTGATASHKGYFEQASGGTLFLNEVGEMSAGLQAKFLQVLDDGHITPLGGTQRKPVDVRVVAATNANLQAKIAEGFFRRDLYHRLAHYTITISPLRDRREDIPLLVDYFLEHFAMEMGREMTTICPQAMQALMDYHFPGNVRELKNMIERALIQSGHRPIQPEHLDFLSLPLPATNLLPAPASLGFPPTLSPNRMEVLLIKGTLVETNGDVEAAARLLRMRPDHIRALREDTSPPPLSAAEERILAYVRENGGITNRACCQLLGININQAYRLLDKLDRTGSLVREGKRRWAFYRLP